MLNRCTVKSCTGGSNPPLSALPFHYLPASCGVNCADERRKDFISAGQADHGFSSRWRTAGMLAAFGLKYKAALVIGRLAATAVDRLPKWITASSDHEPRDFLLKRCA